MFQDPAIKTMKGYKPYDDGVREDIFIKDENGDILEGQVWPGKTAYPDFFNPNTSLYWFNQIKEFHEKFHFDGLWIVSIHTYTFFFYKKTVHKKFRIPKTVRS